ncbi:MAG TPA: LLM class flavin-dependent oxidoreductase [Stellaceae bacterium]|nr:LLM class flavin-dependent oxidoreductase [Stellaceae bacterium]
MSPYAVHPVYAAMAAATLDEYFPGRVQLCFGVGAPRDLEAAGIEAPQPRNIPATGLPVPGARSPRAWSSRRTARRCRRCRGPRPRRESR